ncbi:hypothetical protein ACIPV2_10105 [Microbacterium sp. NPDC089987]|uniref:hypothetical protein n=1 Tax=Microbacterium sp. NPDC089987 TaxID=3364202 RepID=UPI00382BAA91
MRRHLKWIVLLVSAPLSYLVAMLLMMAAREAQTSAEGSGIAGLVLAQLLLMLLAVGVPIWMLVWSIVEMTRVHRRAQRAKGRFTPFEQQQLAAARSSAAAWEHARAVRTSIMAGQMPPALPAQWDVVPDQGEVFFGHVPVTYARYYGQDITYRQSSTVALGRPAFIVGALAVTAIANAAARSQADKQAATQWREWQNTGAYVTSHRIAVHASGEWLSFDYAAMTAVYPEVASQTLVCQFSSTSPLLLSGDGAALSAVIAVAQAYGRDAVGTHPALTALDRPAPEPALRPIGRTGTR